VSADCLPELVQELPLSIRCHAGSERDRLL
jgi:hypothetical protein